MPGDSDFIPAQQDTDFIPVNAPAPDESLKQPPAQMPFDPTNQRAAEQMHGMVSLMGRPPASIATEKNFEDALTSRAPIPRSIGEVFSGTPPNVPKGMENTAQFAMAVPQLAQAASMFPAVSDAMPLVESIRGASASMLRDASLPRGPLKPGVPHLPFAKWATELVVPRLSEEQLTEGRIAKGVKNAQIREAINQRMAQSKAPLALPAGPGVPESVAGTRSLILTPSEARSESQIMRMAKQRASERGTQFAAGMTPREGRSVPRKPFSTEEPEWRGVKETIKLNEEAEPRE